MDKNWLKFGLLLRLKWYCFLVPGNNFNVLPTSSTYDTIPWYFPSQFPSNIKMAQSPNQEIQIYPSFRLPAACPRFLSDKIQTCALVNIVNPRQLSGADFSRISVLLRLQYSNSNCSWQLCLFLEIQTLFANMREYSLLKQNVLKEPLSWLGIFLSFINLSHFFSETCISLNPYEVKIWSFLNDQHFLLAT